MRLFLVGAALLSLCGPARAGDKVKTYDEEQHYWLDRQKPPPEEEDGKEKKSRELTAEELKRLKENIKNKKQFKDDAGSYELPNSKGGGKLEETLKTLDDAPPGEKPEPAGKPKAGKPQAAADPDAPVAQRAADLSEIQVTSRGERAMGSAARFSSGLDQGYKASAGDMAGKPAGAKPADPKPTGKTDPKAAAILQKLGATPANAPDPLLVQSLSGRKQILGASGFKVIPGPSGQAIVLRRDGSPASPPEIAGLRQALNDAPEALVRRPDFFSKLPPQHYAALKQTYAPEKPAYQDIALVQQRDFTWTRSCSAVSGGCNPAAPEGRYEKGKDVSPETLETIYKKEEATAAAAEEPPAIEDFDEDDEKLAAAARAAEEAPAPVSILGAATAKLRALLAGLGLGGGGDAAASDDAPSAARGGSAPDMRPVMGGQKEAAPRARRGAASWIVGVVALALAFLLRRR